MEIADTLPAKKPRGDKIAVLLCFTHAILANVWIVYSVAIFLKAAPDPVSQSDSDVPWFLLWVIFTYSWLMWPVVMPAVGRAYDKKLGKPLLGAFLIWLVAGTSPVWLFILFLYAASSHC